MPVEHIVHRHRRQPSPQPDRNRTTRPAPASAVRGEASLVGRDFELFRAAHRTAPCIDRKALACKPFRQKLASPCSVSATVAGASDVGDQNLVRAEVDSSPPVLICEPPHRPPVKQGSVVLGVCHVPSLQRSNTAMTSGLRQSPGQPEK